MKVGLIIGIVVVLLILVFGAVVILTTASGDTKPPPGGDLPKFDTTLKGWQPIAYDGGMFELSAPTTVRWGVDTRMVDLDLTPGVYVCGMDATFRAKSDPAVGTVKQCFIDGSKTGNLVYATSGPYAGSWSAIADAPNGIRTAKEPIDVRFGAGNVYWQSRINGEFTCKPLTFGGDPLIGTAKKCYVEDPNEVV